MNIQDKIIELPFVGLSYAKLLEKLDIKTIGDLLNHFPRKYTDTRKLSLINDLDTSSDKIVVLRAQLLEIQNVRLRGGKTLQKATISDDSGTINVMWFNQPFLTKNLKLDHYYFFSGKLNPKKLIPELSSPKYEEVRDNSDQISINRISPIYPTTGKVSLKWLQKRIFDIVDKIDSINDLHEFTPDEIIEKYKLVDIKTAYRAIHFPKDTNELIEARRRLAFDELLEIQKKLLIKRQKRFNKLGIRINADSEIIKEISERFKFELTKTQRSAIEDIQNDLSRSYPMYRLIQGDVGSGKTILAFISAYLAAKSGFQTIILTPTAVLAKQHYESALELFPKDLSIQLVTSDTIKKLKKANSFKADVIVATHAILFHHKELVNKLGLIIVDEEHRFGVKQREYLNEMLENDNLKTHPHYISMTATPIPRTIALSLFGNMDVSRIEKPLGRIDVTTHIVPLQKLNDSYLWISKIINEGGQAYWICPLIEESEVTDKQSVETTYKKLQNIFPQHKIGFIHGKMKQEDKDTVLQKFSKNNINILVATTVIEVGINIPNANLIIIENAVQFGLAQLHQLRGRVGRNNQKSWCLVYLDGSESTPGLKRLQYFEKETDGNKLAEFDLQLRGPGEVYGTSQSGIPELKVARFSNKELLLETREAAEYLLNS